MKRKVLKIALVIFLILIVAGVLIKLRYDRMVEVLATTEIEEIQLESMDSGVYLGEFRDFLVSVSVEVTVEDNRITSIEITDQRCGSGYEALETIPRIIDAQDPRVDAVSGATSSSRCIMLAVGRALDSTAD